MEEHPHDERLGRPCCCGGPGDPAIRKIEAWGFGLLALGLAMPFALLILGFLLACAELLFALVLRVVE